MRITSKCPPGVICLSPNVVFFAIMIVAGAIYLYKLQPLQPLQQQQHFQIPQMPPINVQVQSNSNSDDRYTRAPKPERPNSVGLDMTAVWNSPAQGLPAIPTRGVPESYQSMGIIKMENGEILPLYGRRTASRSDRFQYYTRTDTYNPVQLPLEHKRRNCQDDVGCEELYDRDAVKVSGMGTKGDVTLYRFAGPAYIPGV